MRHISSPPPVHSSAISKQMVLLPPFPDRRLETHSQSPEVIYSAKQHEFASTRLSIARAKTEPPTMTGRMSIDWLLNGNDDSSHCPHQSNTFAQSRAVPEQGAGGGRMNRYSDRHDRSAASLISLSSRPLDQDRAPSVRIQVDFAAPFIQPRAARPKYGTEEDHFIWYHRIDLDLSWREVSNAFNKHFWDGNREGECGLQCRFYRILQRHQIPSIRTLKQGSDKELLAQNGLVQKTSLRYDWMRPEHRDSRVERADR